ncbi:MAG: Ig domain-containing protein [Bryobacterales bacterium]
MRFFPLKFAPIMLLALLGATLPAQQPAQLTITTNSPLPPGTVGSAYSLTFEASGGSGARSWAVVAGGLPAGLSLTAATGIIAGTPTALGTFNFQVRVSDSSGQNSAPKTFSITIDPQGLMIRNDATLPRARVGTQYLAQLNAAGGTQPYRNWRITEGQLPPGITLLPISGQLNGAPTSFGTFQFTVAVDDSAFETASKRFTLFVDPANLTITTASPLPLGVVGVPYERTLTASGGPPPLRWEALGGMPGGLTLSEAGAISGTPGAIGSFTIQVRATDAASGTAATSLSLTVADPRATITLEGGQGPGEQPTVRLAMASAHPFGIAGQLGVTFQPAAINNSNDGTIKFPNGLQTVQFTVAANSTAAQLGVADPRLATGTTAGLLTIRVTALQAGSQAIPPAADAKLELTIAPAVPSITAASIANRAATGVTLQVEGFSTPREVTRALFQFTPITGRTLQNSQVTVDLTAPANTWYQGAASAATGGQFLYTQPFTIQGDLNAIQSVAITLTNSAGNSQPATVSF